MPRLQQLAEAYAKRDVVVLALNTGDPVERIRGYWEKEKFTLKVLREKDREISAAFGVEAYPTNYDRPRPQDRGPNRRVHRAHPQGGAGQGGAQMIYNGSL